MSFFSAGGSKSKTQQNQEEQAQFGQNIWGPQGNALAGMYGANAGLYGQMMPYANLGFGMMPQMQQWMANTYGQGSAGADKLLGGGSYGDTTGVRNTLYNSLADSANSPSEVGKMYESIVGGKGNTYIDPLVSSMRQSYGDELTRQQSNMGLNAVDAGQSGSSRHAMQNSMLGAQAAKDMAGLENSMRAGAYDTDLNWKMDIAKQADAGRGAAQDRMMSVLGGADANVGAGMGFLPQQQNLGMGYMAPWMQAMQAPWMNMNYYSSNIGDPTVLGSGSSSSNSRASSGSGSAGFSFF